MTISLSDNGAELGRSGGEELALKMLREVGFVDTEVYDVPHDPFGSLYVTHKTAG